MNSSVSIYETPEGPLLSLAGEWSDDLLRHSEIPQVIGIELSSLRGKRQEDLQFLEHFPSLQYFGCLYGQPVDYTALYSFPSIKSLRFLNLRGVNFDFSRFPNLQSIGATWNPALTSIFECKHLRFLSLVEFDQTSSRCFGSLSSLQGLLIKDSALREIDSFSMLGNLKALELVSLRKLETLDPAFCCEKIKCLRIANCGKRAAVDNVSKLTHLQALLIDMNKEVANLQFVEALEALRIFNFTLNVHDGDIKRLLNCKKLVQTQFPEKRHYNLSLESLNATLQATRPKLTSKEIDGFRSVSYGLDDWHRVIGPGRSLIEI